MKSNQVIFMNTSNLQNNKFLDFYDNVSIHKSYFKIKLCTFNQAIDMRMAKIFSIKFVI